jgi:hypothetical protein
MSRRDYIRAKIAIAMTRLYPKLVRDAVISDPTLTERLGITADAVLHLGDVDVAFQRSKLLDAVKLALGGATPDPSIDDTLGQSWKVRVLRDEAFPRIALVQDKRRLLVANFGWLSPDPDTRTKIFAREAERLNLPAGQIANWESLLSQRIPAGDELALIQGDLNNTPSAVSETIGESLANGGIEASVLVPRLASYYDRLVGACAGETCLEDYILDAGAAHMKALVGWRAEEGFKLSLLLASQPNIATALGGVDIAIEKLAAIFEWLADRGDALSRAAGIEIGLRVRPADPTARAALEKLVRAFVADQPVAHVNQFALLSALTVFVYGEMARCRILADRPPFQRRLAAIAQASLIARCIIANSNDATDFMKWLASARLQTFLLQGFIDLRTEPRWVPEMALPGQMRNEVSGRVWMAAQAQAEFVRDSGWAGLLLDDVEGSLARTFSLYHAVLPGPLEGGTPSSLELRPEDIASLREDLLSSTITASSFAGLYRAAVIFSLPDGVTELAAGALARADYRLACDDGRLVAHLLGIASSAAIARSAKLAEALFIVLRVHRRYYPADLTVEDSFRIGMVACACHADFDAWCKCVGDRLNELSFQAISREDAERLHSHLLHLCALVPELWATCGQAEAALRSVIGA